MSPFSLAAFRILICPWRSVTLQGCALLCVRFLPLCWGWGVSFQLVSLVLGNFPNLFHGCFVPPFSLFFFFYWNSYSAIGPHGLTFSFSHFLSNCFLLCFLRSFFRSTLQVFCCIYNFCCHIFNLRGRVSSWHSPFPPVAFLLLCFDFCLFCTCFPQRSDEPQLFAHF